MRFLVRHNRHHKVSQSVPLFKSRKTVAIFLRIKVGGHFVMSIVTCHESHYVGVLDNPRISNAFNEHFINIQQTNTSVPDCIDSNVQDARLVNFIKSHISEATVFHIPPISTQQVIKDIKSIPNNKATGLDGIGIKPLKLALNAIAPSLTHIYNSSIASGTFPINFKRAKLIPVYKKK